MNTQNVKWFPIKGKCRICKKTGWCTVASNGAMCCMRVESAVPMRNGGWLHLDDSLKGSPVKVQVVVEEKPLIDSAALMSKWSNGTPPNRRSQLAAFLGVSALSLYALNASWAPEHRAWAFPMFDGQGSICGIRLRNNDGEKWAVKCSRQGVFIPSGFPEKTAYIPEGPTDTAAAVTLGLFAIGRPSCSAGAEQLRGACIRLGIKRLVMVADSDDPGMKGAVSVAQKVGLPWVAILPPGAKDLREFVRNGGTKEILQAIVNNQVWNQS